MLIVLEGCDGVGKTTFGDVLAERATRKWASVRFLSRSRPQRHVMEEYELDLERSYQRVFPLARLLICDRWHLGELVYGPLLRGESQLTFGAAWHVDAFLRSRGAVQVVMHQSPDVVRERLASRGEDLLKLDDVEQVCSHYRFLSQVFRDSVVEFVGDPTDHDVDELVRTAREAARRVVDLHMFSTYVGPPDPEIVLLGERRKFQETRPDHAAAFVPYPGTSGHWLCDAVATSDRLFHKRIGLANACEENVPELVRTLGNPRVVALGRLADRECDRYDVPHGSVPHPQYGRRFKHHEQDAYTAAIYEAATEHGRVEPRW